MRSTHRLAIAYLSVIFLLGSAEARAQRVARTGGPVPVARSLSSTSAPLTTARHRAAVIPNSIFPNRQAGESLLTGLEGQSLYTGLSLNTLGNPNLGVRAAIDPVTELRIATAKRFLRNERGLFPGEYYLLDGGGAYMVPTDESDSPQTQQPQVIVLQQASPAQDSSVQGPVEATPNPPLPDEGQFTLILQGGKQIQAVAFTHMKDQIVYITPDGSRHAIEVKELDSDATIRVNQERGTPLELPL
jgi:hypothetical protein